MSGVLKQSVQTGKMGIAASSAARACKYSIRILVLRFFVICWIIKIL